MRKTTNNPLDLYTHINQYVRTFSTPVVQNIKVEPSNFLVSLLKGFHGKSLLKYIFSYFKDVNIGEVENEEIESIGGFVSESEETESCDDAPSDDEESQLFNGNGSYSLVKNYHF